MKVKESVNPKNSNKYNWIYRSLEALIHLRGENLLKMLKVKAFCPLAFKIKLMNINHSSIILLP